MSDGGKLLLFVLILMTAVFFDWLYVFKIRNKKKPSLPKIKISWRAFPVGKAIQIFDFSLGVILIYAGQSLIAGQGETTFSISTWLNDNFHLGIINLDNVLVGIPLLWVGGFLLIRLLNRFGLFAQQEDSLLLRRGAFAFRYLREKTTWLAAVAGLIFVILLALLNGKQYNNAFPVLWLISISILAFLAWRWDRRSGISLSPHLARIDLIWITALILAGLIVASFQLQAIPNQLMGDEGNFWNTARDIANGKYAPPIYGFGVYTFGILSSFFQAAVLKIFGVSLWSWRFSSVLAGLASIPPLYLLGRELFNRRVAVASSIALITAPYFLAFARLGYNNIQTLFVVTLALFLAYMGFSRNSAFYLFLGGCAAGLAIYTYTAATGAAIVVILFLVTCFFLQRQKWRSLLRAGIIFILGWMVVSFPNSTYGNAVNPEAFRVKPFESFFFNTGYGADIFGDLPAFVEAPRLEITRDVALFISPSLYSSLLVRGVSRTLLVYNSPFLVSEHFIASPLAGPVAAVFFSLGSILALFRLRQRRFLLLILWFGINALVFSAANTFPPRHQHMVGIIPVMSLFIGLGIVAMIDLASKLVPRISNALRNLLLAFLLLLIGVTGVYNYFVTMPERYRPSFEQVISWYSLYARSQTIYYVYNSQENKDFKPFVLREIRTDLTYKMIPAADYGLQPGKYPFEKDALIFFSPATAGQVFPTLKTDGLDQRQERTFYNREGQPIGMAVGLLSSLDILPANPGDVLSDSYNRPVNWLILFTASLFILFTVFRRSWLPNAPPWLFKMINWVTLPPNMKENQDNLTVSEVPGSTLNFRAELQQIAVRLSRLSRSNFRPALLLHKVSISGLIRLLAPVNSFLAKRLWLSISTVLLALILACLGQFDLFTKESLAPGIWYLLGGGTLFTLSTLVYGYIAPASEPHAEVSKYLISSPQIRWRLVFVSVLIAVANLLMLNSRQAGQSHWDLFGLWIVSIFLLLLAFFPQSHSIHLPIQLSKSWKKLLPLAVILAAGFILRFYQLGGIPAVMENDEGIVGVQALKVLSGNLNNMFQTFGGYGTLHFFLMSIPVNFLGRTLLAIRFDTALYGWLSLPLIYLLSRKMFNYKVALVSTALLAAAHLAIQFSRVSPTASSLDPLLSTLSFLLLYQALHSRRPLDWALTGVVMGLGLYFYVGARVITLILAGFLILMLIFNRNILRGNWRNILVLAASYLVTAFPMLLWAAQNPDAFNARMNQVGILQNGWLAAEMGRQGVSVLAILWQQFVESFLIFFYSHPDWFYGALVPALGPLTGAAFLFGLMASLPKLKQPRFALLNSWFWVTLITGQVLAVDPAPNAYRTLGLIPAVCIFAAVALVGLSDRLFAWLPKIGKIAPAVFLSIILLLEAGWNTWNYFDIWALQNRYSDTNSQLASFVGSYLGQQSPGTIAYIAATPPFRAKGWSSIEYLRNSIYYEDVEQPFVEVVADLELGQHTLFILPTERRDELAVLQKALPGGRVINKYLGNQLYFIAYLK